MSPVLFFHTTEKLSGFLGLSGFGDGLGCGLITGGFFGGFLSSFCAEVTTENAASIAKLINVYRKILISNELPFLSYSRLTGKEGKDVRRFRCNPDAKPGFMTPRSHNWLDKEDLTRNCHLHNFTFSHHAHTKR
jgi:hypothetical protein